VAVVVTSGDLDALVRQGVQAGDWLMLLAVLIFAGYSVMLSRRGADLPSLVLLAVTTLVGLLLLTPLYAWETAVAGHVRFDTRVLASVLYLGAGAAALGFLVWERAIASVGPAIAGHFLHLVPLFGVILAAVLLDEVLEPAHACGFLLILAGILAGQRSGRAAPARASTRSQAIG
jgi:drug/metabolite transporter (DMT)-like permease